LWAQRAGHGHDQLGGMDAGARHHQCGVATGVCARLRRGENTAPTPPDEPAGVCVCGWDVSPGESCCIRTSSHPDEPRCSRWERRSVCAQHQLSTQSRAVQLTWRLNMGSSPTCVCVCVKLCFARTKWKCCTRFLRWRSTHARESSSSTVESPVLPPQCPHTSQRPSHNRDGVGGSLSEGPFGADADGMTEF